MSDLFLAGTRVAFHVHPRGRYRGGLAGVDARFIAREAMHLRVCLALTDRHGTRRELSAGAT